MDNKQQKRWLNWDKAIGKTENFRIERGVNSFINPFSLLRLGETEGVTDRIDRLYVDGISLVRLINFFQRRGLKRYSFDDTSVAPEVFRFVKEQGLKLAIIGTTPAYLTKAVSILEERYQFKAAYTRDGFFTDAGSREEALKEVTERGIDVVVCGMGTPLQEQFLIDLKEKGWQGFGYTCGGYLHQLATKEKYYPRFFDVLNIRWVYRIIDEPKLFHRYFVLYPVFAFHFLVYCFNKKKR